MGWDPTGPSRGAQHDDVRRHPLYLRKRADEMVLGSGREDCLSGREVKEVLASVPLLDLDALPWVSSANSP
jgi:hypothetical protein